MADLGNLVVKLTADASQAKSTLANLRAQLDDFKRNATIGIIGFAGYESIKHLTDGILEAQRALESTLNTSKNLGISLASLQKLQFIAERGGTSADALTTSFSRLSKNLIDIKNNAEKAAQEIDKLGTNKSNDLNALGERPSNSQDKNSLAYRNADHSKDDQADADYDQKKADILAKYNNEMLKSAAPTDKASEALAKLNIDSAAFIAMPFDKQFDAISAGLAKITSAEEKSATLMQLFGRGGSQLAGAFRENADGAGKSFDKNATGGTSNADAEKIKKAQDDVAAVGVKWTQFKNQVAADSAAIVGDIAKLISSDLDAIKAGMNDVKNRFDSLKQDPSLKNAVTGQNNPSKSVADVAKSDTQGLKNIASDVTSRIQQVFNIQVTGDKATVEQTSGDKSDLKVNVEQTAQDTARQVAR